MTMQEERSFRLWKNRKETMTQWLYNRYGFLTPYQRKIVIVARDDVDAYRSMIVNRFPHNPMNPSTLFLNVTRVEGRAYYLRGWAFGDDDHWVKTTLPPQKPVYSILDFYQQERADLRQSLERLKK